MRLPFTFLSLALLSAPAALARYGGGASAYSGLNQAIQRQHEHLDRVKDAYMTASTAHHSHSKRQEGNSSLPFANPAAEPFYVDGTTIPEVNFDAGASWAGLLPISGDPEETKELFFWLWPASNPENADKLLFWTNGGPGCSSMEGFLQENGPFIWNWGQSEPVANPYSWTEFANVVWVEQPVGTGFTQGTPNITNDDELAEQLTGFLGQFIEVFDELQGAEFYLSGESYAGYYVPYIANYIYEHPGLNLNLQGIWIADPSLSYGAVQQDIPALRFVQAHSNVFPFNSSFLESLQNISDACGYTTYLDDYVHYPPDGLLPLVGVQEGSTGTAPECRIFDQITEEIYWLNPVFNIYRVTDTFPNLWSVLGFPRDTQQFIYFNRTDVQDAIHAPHQIWEDCLGPVYVGEDGDQSLPSMLSIMPNVIEKSARTVVVHGLADMILIAEGTRIAIQNMTWAGAQGFQTPIEPESFLVQDDIMGAQGVYGNMHQERNLTYVEFYMSGHMTPQFVPWAAYQTIAYLTGARESPSA
ncbi:Alpha/Beta hydrolase protein [Schizophyllum amplum]|uniref:Carboxypeptidase n=1 Tax=Schizophyllum amplum TaxID=97359 RepID=A0A550CWM6_9AGAR|nr:Alpha/Beta hydrolase protein [Auriculariopsis ampla]